MSAFAPLVRAERTSISARSGRFGRACLPAGQGPLGLDRLEPRDIQQAIGVSRFAVFFLCVVSVDAMFPVVTAAPGRRGRWGGDGHPHSIWTGPPPSIVI